MNGTGYDVAIIGGGPAGAGIALALRKLAPLSVALIERSELGTARLGETLPPDCMPLLTQLGVRNTFMRSGHVPSRGSCASWGNEALGYSDYLFSPWGMGWHLDRRRFDRMLLDEAAKSGVDVHLATELERWEPLGPQGQCLHLKRSGAEGCTLQARFVVDATGREASFATARGARRMTADRGFGVFGFFRVKPGNTFDSRTLVEARPEGWWYSARLPEQRVVATLMGDGDSLRSVKPQAPEHWLALLEQTAATKRRLESCEFTGEPLRPVPANVVQLDRVHGEDWLAVGDAACTWDPLSSQGISNALRSALLAAEALVRHLRGEANALPSYGEMVRKQFQQHLLIRGQYYRMERRWPEAPFWSNREKALLAVSTASPA